VDAKGQIMKAKELKIGDSVFLPDMQFKPGIVTGFYYSTSENMIISLDNGFGIHAPPDQDILVGREGQVL
jgi:hypothetical protein